jgi:hypothetical protein
MIKVLCTIWSLLAIIACVVYWTLIQTYGNEGGVRTFGTICAFLIWIPQLVLFCFCWIIPKTNGD